MVADVAQRPMLLGELGGMPSPDLASMRKTTLMQEAKRLGVPTRREVTSLGKRTHQTWRSVNEVAAECAAKWEERQGTASRLCQRVLASMVSQALSASTCLQRLPCGTTLQVLQGKRWVTLCSLEGFGGALRGAWYDLKEVNLCSRLFFRGRSPTRLD